MEAMLIGILGNENMKLREIAQSSKVHIVKARINRAVTRLLPHCVMAQACARAPKIAHVIRRQCGLLQLSPSASFCRCHQNRSLTSRAGQLHRSL